MRIAVLREPVVVFLLSWAACDLLFKINWWLVRPVQFYLLGQAGMESDHVLIVLRAAWVAIALGVGTTLGRFFPRYGNLILAGTSFLVILRILVLQEAPLYQVLGYVIVPMCLAGVLGHRNRFRKMLAQAGRIA